MVRPDDEAQNTDGNHRIDHRQIAEDRLFREGRDDLADDAKGRQDDDVHFRVAKEPQDVLIKDRIAATGRIKEGGAEVAVSQQHGDGTGQNRQRQQDQPGGDEDRPGEQRHFVHGHARRAHVQEGGDHVDRAKDGRCTREVDRENRKIHRVAFFAGGQRRVQNPAHAGPKLAVAAGGEHRRNSKGRTCDEHPVAEVVHAGEGHIRRADLQRHEVVAKAAEQRRDDHKEHHQNAVAGDQHVPEVAVGGAFCRCGGGQAHAFFAHVLHAGVHKFHPHVNGEQNRNEAYESPGKQIKDPDILVVRRHEPAGKEPALIMIGAMNGCIGHGRLLLSVLMDRVLARCAQPDDLILCLRGQRTGGNVCI